MARIASIEQARTPCPRSPYSNRAHEWRPVPPYVAVRFAEPPLFYCVFDMLFLTEENIDKLVTR